jgi:hypothetical protein
MTATGHSCKLYLVLCPLLGGKVYTIVYGSFLHAHLYPS